MPDLNLPGREREEILGYLQRGQKLPPKYRALLFEQPHAAELIWPGKTSEVTNVVLPFQQIEQIDEPRKEGSSFADLFAWDRRTGRQTGGWTNKLIWGDNKLVLSSLKNGPLRRQIEDAGGLKLVYIDPPFDVGADFAMDIEIGEDFVTKSPSVIEEIAYRDTWGRGKESFASMIYERLRLLCDLMAPGASIYVHCDWRLTAHMRLLMDEIFGDHFQREIIWSFDTKSGYKTIAENWIRSHETILFYSKGEKSTFNKQYISYSEDYLRRFLQPTKSLFNKVVGDSHFELEFAAFLDRCDDIVAFAKNDNRPDTLRIDYQNSEGGISHYVPDFLVKVDEKKTWVVETKGREDLNDPRKWERLKQWCADATAADAGRTYSALFVDESDWKKGAPSSFAEAAATYRT